jgi:hypothetical protein
MVVHSRRLSAVVAECRHAIDAQRLVLGVRPDKWAFSSGCKPHPATARSGQQPGQAPGGDEVSEASRSASRNQMTARVFYPVKEALALPKFTLA